MDIYKDLSNMKGTPKVKGIGLFFFFLKGMNEFDTLSHITVSLVLSLNERFLDFVRAVFERIDI